MRKHVITVLNACIVLALLLLFVATAGVGPLDTEVHVAYALGGRADGRPPIRLVAYLNLDNRPSGRGRFVGEHPCRRGHRVDLCAVALDPTHVLPYTLLLQTVPILAIAPLILMWMGPGILSVMCVAFIICLAPIIANTTQGLISVDQNLINLFLMHNANPAQVMWKLRLPNSIPSLFTGIRIASGISVIGAITGELFAGSSRVGVGGLGYSILYASSQLETDYLFALVFAATILGFSFFFIMMFLEWYFLHNWHESARAPETE